MAERRDDAEADDDADAGDNAEAESRRPPVRVSTQFAVFSGVTMVLLIVVQVVAQIFGRSVSLPWIVYPILGGTFIYLLNVSLSQFTGGRQ